MLPNTADGGLRRRRTTSAVPLETVFEDFKQLDAFPKVPEEFKKSTPSGVGLSIFVALLTLILVGMELHYYFTPVLHYSYEVDTQFNRRLGLNLDIVVASPCYAIGADVLDKTESNVMGGAGSIKETSVTFDPESESEKHIWKMLSSINEQFRDAYHSLHKVLWLEGTDLGHLTDSFLGGKTDLDADAEADSLSRTEPPVLPGHGGAFMVIGGMVLPVMSLNNHPDTHSADNDNGKGSCRLTGSIVLNKVGGNLHVIAGKTMPGFPGGHMHISMNADDSALNFSHRIAHLSFGRPVKGMVHPLDGITRIDLSKRTSFQYFIKIIPTMVDTRLAPDTETFQYSVQEFATNVSHAEGNHGMPGIFIRYDFSALAFHISERAPISFYKLVLRLTGIIGGIYSLTGALHKIYGVVASRLSKVLRGAGRGKSCSSSLASAATVTRGSVVPGASKPTAKTAFDFDFSDSDSSIDSDLEQEKRDSLASSMQSMSLASSLSISSGLIPGTPIDDTTRLLQQNSPRSLKTSNNA